MLNWIPAISREALNWAQVVSAVATMAGVLVALWFSQQAARRQRAVDERSQARLMFGYVQIAMLARNVPTGRMVLVNASDAPVYDVIVSAGTYVGTGPEFFDGDADTTVVPVLNPGRYSIDGPVVAPIRLTRDQTTDPSTRRNVALTFRDSGGTWWERTARGELRKLRRRDGFSARSLTSAHLWAEIREVG